jgi:hypothetical protein
MHAKAWAMRLSTAIYPVTIMAGAVWGATGRPGAGLATLLLVATLVSGLRRD